jgi:predicted NACHT family NTPase
MNQNNSGTGDNVIRDKNQTYNIQRDLTQQNIVYHTPPPNQPQRDKNQQELIKYIGEMVDRLLSQSLRNQVYINLDKVEDFSKVTAPMQLKFAEQKAQPLPPETTIIEVYHCPDINGRLLILGDPGSGKSTNLYKLAQELVIRAKDDINQPIPILFNLSSRAGRKADSSIKNKRHKQNKLCNQSRSLAKLALN